VCAAIQLLIRHRGRQFHIRPRPHTSLDLDPASLEPIEVLDEVETIGLGDDIRLPAVDRRRS
jgi:hypothetical protein